MSNDPPPPTTKWLLSRAALKKKRGSTYSHYVLAAKTFYAMLCDEKAKNNHQAGACRYLFILTRIKFCFFLNAIIIVKLKFGMIPRFEMPTILASQPFLFLKQQQKI
jgi:hypothetical protein